MLEEKRYQVVIFYAIWHKVGYTVYYLAERPSRQHHRHIFSTILPSSIIRGCQSGRWSLRGTKVNGFYHDDSPLLKPGSKSRHNNPWPGPTTREQLEHIIRVKTCLWVETILLLYTVCVTMNSSSSIASTIHANNTTQIHGGPAVS